MCKTNSPADRTEQSMNHLKNETSPYLLQHVYNPVDWYPWNAETLALAKEQDKMMIISVGYAACHWCHVMEHESFEDSLVAAIMNEHFIPVKVDREERPDVDDVYMTACQLVSRRGCGWPLNALALPDGRPFWATTYNPRDQWIKILQHFAEKYQKDRGELERSADQIMHGIRQSEQMLDLTNKQLIEPEQLQKVTEKFLEHQDKKWGARRGAPKFPMPDNYLFLMRYLEVFPHNDELEHYVDLALTKMAYGGIYDHAGGGFARYSTDPKWLVPHFEKMLYDNAQLVQVYAEAFQRTANPLYKQVVERSLRFVDRELSDPAGGFYSSLDADSEGEEGKFYIWTEEQIDRIVADPKQAQLFKDFYNITRSGNWEHGQNILFQTESLQHLADKWKMSASALREMLDNILDRLMKERDQRVRPGLDDKVLTSWNALMIKGYIAAYRATKNQQYLDRAQKAISFILTKQLDSTNQLFRNYKSGRSTIHGFLDDYAFLIDALIEMYQITLNKNYLERARELANYTLDHFFDDKTSYFFYTSDLDDPLITRKKELDDNVTPSSNAVMAMVLFKLGHFYDNKHYLKVARHMAKGMSANISGAGMPHFYAHWLQLMLLQNHPPKEIAIVGKDALQVLHQLSHQTYLPGHLFLGALSEDTLPLLQNKYQEGRTLIYVCQNKTCKFPTNEIHTALKLIKE